jgi:hypothetical protein
MASLDREIAHLYQLPLSEFTKARDELARREESHRAAIRRLEKPNLPAWAVNQLYWRDRGAYEALAAAGERLRKAQVAALAGKPGDVGRVEAEHQAARREAADRVRRILVTSGEKTTAATLSAVNDTLGALPSSESPGRLVRPLKPMGFEGLAGLLKGDRIASPRADLLLFRKPSPAPETPTKAQAAKSLAAAAKQAEKDARRRADERRKAASKVAGRLREAEAAERSARAEWARAKAALAKAERDHQHAAARLEATAARVDALSRDVRAGERQTSQAAIARADLEGQLKALAAPDDRR